jgi:K+-sensing histidine kinase KdpD
VRTIRGSGDIDVHIVTHAHMGRGRGLPRAHGGLTTGRRLAGYALAAVLAPLLTFFLASLRHDLNLTTDVLAFLVAVIAVALVGGFVPAVVEAVAGSLLLNFYFTPPIHKFTIAEKNNACSSRSGWWSAPWSTTQPGAASRQRGQPPNLNCWLPPQAACCAVSRHWRRC